MSNRYYHFKGNSEDIINSILSLLMGKEQYQEISLYSNFLNTSQPSRYQKKLNAILDHMQHEGLILIREVPEESSSSLFNLAEKMDGKTNTPPSANARVHLRQHGRQVLSEGGYKRILNKKSNLSVSGS